MPHASISHIAIIPDGNRRWARDHDLHTYEGHQKGFEVISDLGRHIREIGIPIFTVWAFSTENWKRDPAEVKYLMQIYEKWFQSNLETAKEEEIRIVHIGRRDRIPQSLKQTIEMCEQETASHTQHTLVVALDYGGRDEVARAAARAKMQDEEEESFASYLDTAQLENPNPDLVIRTSGEMRTSGFMIWQAAYAEWIFRKKHLPDFTREDLNDCIAEFEERQRRYGK